MELIRLLSSSESGTCCSHDFGALFLIGFQMTMFVFLAAPAPADIISTEVWNGRLLAKYFFEKLHMASFW